MDEKKNLNSLVGRNIAEARLRKGLTQTDLAKLIGTTNQFISDVERGAAGISLSTLRNLCLVLDVSSDELLFEKPRTVYSAVLTEKMNGFTLKEMDALSEMASLVLKKWRKVK